MNRCMAAIACVLAAGSVLAQAPFTIVRPADGAKVREKVRVLIPKNSIPSGGYIGVFLNGKFLEATVPTLEGKFYVYTLDTKGRGISDGKLNIETVLYVDYNEKPRIVDRSSIDVTVVNRSNIAGTENGVSLRYSFVPDMEYTYKYVERVGFSTLTESQMRSGSSRTAEVELGEPEEYRLAYRVENRDGAGNGLLRVQPLPPKGQNYAVLTVEGATQPARYLDTEMLPVYMKVTNTGRELFGAIPQYFGFDGLGTASRVDLVAGPAMPVLPSKVVTPGSTWQGRFQLPNIDLNSRNEANTLVTNIPARGELLGFEWEMGHPCAKIRNVISEGSSITKNKTIRAAGQEFADGKVQLEEIIYFALDKKAFIKLERNLTIEGKVPQTQNAGFGGGAPGGVPGGFGPPGGVPGGPAGAGGKGRGGRGDLDFNGTPGNSALVQGPPGQAGRPPAGFGGPGGPPGGFGGPGGRGQNPGRGAPGQATGGRFSNGRGAAGGTAQYFRVKLYQLYILQD